MNRKGKFIFLKKIYFKHRRKTNYFLIKFIFKIFKFFFLIFNIILLFVSNKFFINRKTYDVFYPNHKVFIEAHRGVNKKKFQNTKEAITLSIKYDLDSIETDAWLSKDNILVLVHGGFMGNLTNYYNTSNNVVNETWKNLTHYRTLRDKLIIPRLEEILKIAKNKIFLNLEIKDPRIDLVFPYVINLIEKYNFFDQLSISSFHHGYYKKVEEYNNNNKKNKKIVFGFLYGAMSSEKDYIYNLPNNMINIYWSRITKTVCDKAHENGMAVLAWFYMNEIENEQIYQTLFDNGIDVLCTNFPFLAKKFKYSYYKKKKSKKDIRI